MADDDGGDGDDADGGLEPSLGLSDKGERGKSIDQEDRVAEKGGGWRVPGSGALANRSDEMGSGGPAGDVDLQEFKVECKRTDNRSFRIDEPLIRHAFHDAIHADKEMAIAIDIDGIESDVIPTRLVVVAEDVFHELTSDGGDGDDG